MDNHLKRQEIAAGVHFNSVTDKRYKFNRITVGFFVPLDEEKASLYALLPRLLCRTNARYTSAAQFSNYLASLYNAKCDFEVESLGDTQFLAVSMKFMDDGYALHGEKITEEAAMAIFDCVFRPVIEKGENSGFCAADVEILKQHQIEAIEAEINDKRFYAANKAKRILFENEPAAVNPLGNVEKTREITPQSLFAAYKELLKSAVIETVSVGCNDFRSALKIAETEFSKLASERKNIAICQSAYSKAKSKTAEKTERLPLNQSNMVLGFKTALSGNSEKAALTLMSNLYGGTISSKLFLNVREKLSLCYFCWSRVNKYKGAILVSCGVEEENIEKAKAEILLQLENVKKGDFTDDDLKYALLYEQNNVKTVNDSLNSLTWWYFTRIYTKEIKSPEEYLKDFENIKRDDVMSVAGSMIFDTFYVLSGIEENEK
ncbi:MAG: insulinase family protein [Oscillospiraceae bacterium]|nr:insulinase family protein [Oscillospiraceae bacterium]